MTQRRPGPEFAGSWRIIWTEVWANDALDLVSPACIQFGQDGFGEFGMIAVRGWLDCRYGTREGRPPVESPGTARTREMTFGDVAGRCSRRTGRSEAGYSFIVVRSRDSERSARDLSQVARE